MVVGGFPRLLNLSPVAFSFISLIVVPHFYSLFRCRGFIYLSKEVRNCKKCFLFQYEP